MLKDVTLGRYYRTESFLHALDPRTKLSALVIFIAGVLLSSSLASCIVTFLCLAALIALSRVPLRYMLRGMLMLFVVLVIVAALNILFVPGGAVRAALLCIRLVEIVLCSNLLTLTTRPREISHGVERGLRWMKAFKVPVHDMATIISIAFSFIPLLADEARRIMDAQISRGADFRSGTLVRRAKASVSVIVPVFASAIRRADELSVAMDSRLYGTAEPTRLHELRYTNCDGASYICMFTYLAVMILMKVGRL